MGAVNTQRGEVVEDTEEAGAGGGEAGAHKVGRFRMLLKLSGVRLNLVPLVGVGGRGLTMGAGAAGGGGGGMLLPNALGWVVWEL